MSTGSCLPTLRLALALTTLLWTTVAPAQTAPAAAASAPAAAASGPTVRPAISPALLAAQQALGEKNFAEAQRQLLAAEAVPDRTPYETYLLERMRVVAAAGLRDAPAMLKAIDAALATGQADAEVRLSLMDEASNAAYGIKDYAAAVVWARRYLEAGGTQPVVRLRLGQVLYLQGQHEAAAQELATLATRQRDAGQAPGELQLRLQASNYSKLNDEAGYQRVLEQLAAEFPKPAYWAELLSRLGRQPGFDERLRIDLLRLGAATQAWTQAGPYVELTERALAAGFATEAEKVIDAALARGALGQGEEAAAHRALQQRVRQQAEADRRVAGPLDAKALAAQSGLALFNTGYDQFTAGRSAEALALMAQGLQRGIPRNADDARLRLGAAHVLAGEASKARELLAPLAAAGRADGSSGLARLWLLKLGA